MEPLGLGCRLVATKEAERELGPLFSRPLGVHFFLQGSAGPSISPLYSVPVEGESSIGSKLPRNPPEQPRYGSQLQKDVSFTVCPIRASPGPGLVSMWVGGAVVKSMGIESDRLSVNLTFTTLLAVQP